MTSFLITAARELMSRTVVPDMFWSDGGPTVHIEAVSEFSKQWEFILPLVSTRHWKIRDNSKVNEMNYPLNLTLKQRDPVSGTLTCNTKIHC